MTAEADMIYDNGGPNTLGWYSNIIAGDFTILVADDFTLADGASTITDIHWWGYYVSEPLPDDFSIYIFSDNSGPNLLADSRLGLTVTRSDSGQTINAANVYEYVAYVDPIVLNPNVTYWLSIVNTVPSDGWIWSGTSSNGNTHATDDPNFTGWANVGQDMAFALTDDAVVPEPASLALLGLGLVGFAGRRFRKRA